MQDVPREQRPTRRVSTCKPAPPLPLIDTEILDPQTAGSSSDLILVEAPQPADQELVPEEPQRLAPVILRPPTVQLQCPFRLLTDKPHTDMNPAIVTAGAGTALASFSGVSMLNEMIQQYIVGEGQTISIHLTNRCNTKILSNPQVYMYSSAYGNCFNPPQPTVLPGLTEICSFAGSTSGTAGLLTYDVGDERLAIEFTNYSKGMFCEVMFVGLEVKCDSTLYNKLYDYPPYINKCGTETKREGKECSVKVTMTEMKKSVMKIEVWDKLEQSV